MLSRCWWPAAVGPRVSDGGGTAISLFPLPAPVTREGDSRAGAAAWPFQRLALRRPRPRGRVRTDISGATGSGERLARSVATCDILQRAVGEEPARPHSARQTRCPSPSLAAQQPSAGEAGPTAECGHTEQQTSTCQPRLAASNPSLELLSRNCHVPGYIKLYDLGKVT